MRASLFFICLRGGKMLAVIHHINSPKLKEYPSDVIGMAKNKIKQKEADMLTSCWCFIFDVYWRHFFTEI